MPEPLVWKFLIHIILGVEHMHYKNYIHRDLKTLNIFLTKDNIARVGDLGLSMKIEPTDEKANDAKEPAKNNKENKDDKDDKDDNEIKEDKEAFFDKEEEEKINEIELVEN